jgi:phage shock protein A
MGIFRRIGNLFRGFLSLFISGVEAQAPRALLENQIQKFKQARARFNEHLGKQAGVIQRLKVQIQKEEKEFAQITSRIPVLMKAAPEKAATLAAQREKLKADIEDNKGQLVEAEALFKKLTRERDQFVKKAMSEIDDTKRLISKAELAEAQASLAEIASSESFSPDGQGLSDLKESLEERVANAQGKTRVAQEANENNAWHVTEAEEQAIEADALARFAAEMGMEAPPIDVSFVEVKKPAALPDGSQRLELGPLTVPEAVKVPAD